MPYYEVEITCQRIVCVMADNEIQAEIAAHALSPTNYKCTKVCACNELDEIRDEEVIQKYVDEDGAYTEAK